MDPNREEFLFQTKDLDDVKLLEFVIKHFQKKFGTLRIRFEMTSYPNVDPYVKKIELTLLNGTSRCFQLKYNVEYEAFVLLDDQGNDDHGLSNERKT